MCYALGCYNMVDIGETPEDLQMSIDRLYDYRNIWGLQINIPKTKIIVFRKQGATKRNEIWKYGNDNIEIVNDFIYLGVTLNYTGNFNLNTNIAW